MQNACSVVIPVGPHEYNTRWLSNAIDSAIDQAEKIIIINDSGKELKLSFDWQIFMYQPPWPVGIATAFNFGVGIAQTECVVFLGSDDELKTNCVETCMAAYEREHRRDAYYWMAVEYIDETKSQHVPCNAAMVTKGLWRKTGGFDPRPIGCDAALISAMLRHRPEWFVDLGEQPLYRYRDHPDTNTRKMMPIWSQVDLMMRTILTETWQERSC